MYNKKEITAQLNTWLETFVEQPHPALGGWAPCPYARAARLNNQISIRFGEVSEFQDLLRESIETLEHKEVVVVCFDHHTIDPVSLQEWVAAINQTLLMPVGYVVLEDHPDAVEYVNGVQMNFGHCGLLVVQKLDKLNTASDQLRDKGYYDHWNQAEIDQVVSWRKNEIL
jgi:hypothetical protein